MPTAIALHWTEPTLPFVVARDGQVVARGSVAPDGNMEPSLLDQRVAAALAPHSTARTKLVVALGRGALAWQHLSLPPCPAEELADVVRLQADRDASNAEEDLGFDYLPLMGDEQTPYQVLAVSIDASQLARIRQVCKSANLTLERIVPTAIGWPALVSQSAAARDPSTHIFLAPAENEATLWATHEGQVVLFRQIQLPTMSDHEAFASAVESELRRTLLTLSQHSGGQQVAISLVEHQQAATAEMAQSLSEKLHEPVKSLDVSPQQIPIAQDEPHTPVLSVVGLAIEESLGKAPLVDLLNPRRRPQAQVNIRTYALAATAGALLLSVLAWSGYSKLKAPLVQAAQDQAELTLLEEPLESLNEFERRARAIRDWQSETSNLLLHLQQVSKSLRPAPLAAKDYPAEEDVVLEKFSLDKRQLTIEALARNSRAVQPLENRLRALEYRTQRGKSDPSEKNKKYPWHFKSAIEITNASDPQAAPAAGGSAEEPAT